MKSKRLSIERAKAILNVVPLEDYELQGWREARQGYMSPI